MTLLNVKLARAAHRQLPQAGWELAAAPAQSLGLWEPEGMRKSLYVERRQDAESGSR